VPPCANRLFEGTEKNPNLKLCAAFRHFPEELSLDDIKDVDFDRDLVTFDMKNMLSSLVDRKFFPFKCKKPVSVNEGDPILVIGFPSRQRIEFDDAILWGRAPHLFVANAVTDDKIYINTSRMRGLEDGVLTSDHENAYGGMSGSLCFVIKKNYAVKLVAVVTDHGMHERMFTSRLNHLNSNGTFGQAVIEFPNWKFEIIKRLREAADRDSESEAKSN
jgi:hypothetical protein